MSTELVKAERPLAVIPKALRKKEQLGWRGYFYVYLCVSMFIPSMITFGLSIFWIIDWPLLGLAIAFLVISILIALASGLAFCICIDENLFVNRTNQWFWNKSRMYATHAEQRKGRTKIAYTQYAPHVSWNKSKVIIEIVTFTPKEGSLFGFNGKVTSLKYNGGGRDPLFPSGNARLELLRPSLQELNDALTQADKRAAEMEEAAYQESLEEAHLKRMVLGVRSPKSAQARQDICPGCDKIKEIEAGDYLCHDCRQ